MGHCKCDTKVLQMIVYIVAIYAAGLLIANILASHMLQVGGFTVSAGILTFPITYILASILGEVYGYRWARRAAWLALALNALMAGLIFLAIRLPQPEWYDGIYFAEANGASWRIVLASFVAFTIGKFINDRIFQKLKGGRANFEGFKFRAMTSSLAGHVIDSTIFTFVAFLFIIPWQALPEMIVVSVVLKWGYEWMFLPITSVAVRKVAAMEAINIHSI